MQARKLCPHCRRSIDVSARVCPFCNFEQEVARADPEAHASITLPSEPPAPLSLPKPAPPPWWANRVFVVAAVILLLASTFAVGALVNVIGNRGRTDRTESEPATATQTAQTKSSERPGNLRLVPVDDTTMAVNQIVTSAPPAATNQQLPAEYQRTDATALPSDQYSRILSAPKPTPTAQSTVVDPRTLQGGMLEQARREEELRRERKRQLAEKQQQEEVGTATSAPPDKRESTRPVPVYQPLPKIDRQREIRGNGTFRFALTVGKNGQVKEIRVIESMPRLTPRMIAAIQRWRFKPATLNGEPVEGTFDVEISLNAGD